MERVPGDPRVVHPLAHGGVADTDDMARRSQRIAILSTEHWNLLATRSLSWSESFSRASMFLTVLSGAVVALALVAQGTDFGPGFVAFALVLLPVVYFLGFVTIVRLGQVNRENARWVQGMNRIRNAYLQLAPELEPYFVTSRFDDRAGVLQSAMAMRSPPAPTQAFVAAPGIVAVVDSVVAGATAAVAAIGLDLGLAGALALGGGLFVLSIAAFTLWAARTIPKTAEQLDIMFPSPPAGS